MVPFEHHPLKIFETKYFTQQIYVMLRNRNPSLGGCFIGDFYSYEQHEIQPFSSLLSALVNFLMVVIKCWVQRKSSGAY